MKRIQWLLSLEKDKLILALLLIVVSTIYIDNKIERYKNITTAKENNDAYILYKKACDSEKIAIYNEFTKKYEEFLKEQIEKVDLNQRKADSIFNKNNSVVEKTNKILKQIIK